MRGNKKMPGLFIPLAALALLVSGGCGTTNGILSKEKIFQGNKAIGEAKESNASLNAPNELKAAVDKLAAAETALTNHDYQQAAWLAEEASVDADYARAKAMTEKARKTAEEMRQNIQALRQEIERMPQ